MMECDESEVEFNVKDDQFMNNSNDNQNNDNEESKDTLLKTRKKPLNVTKDKRGIVYMSYIPKGMNVQKIRQIFSQFGDVERIYLQPDKSLKRGKSNKKTSRNVQYTEGWIEFKKKRIAKRIAKTLNGTQIGGKRKSAFYDCIWSIKYLRKFKWSHLTEQMTYEKALKDQRLRFEIGHAKKEANFYTNMVLQNKKRKKKDLNDDDSKDAKMIRNYKQRLTDEEIKNNQKSQINNDVDMDLLNRIFI